MTAPDLTKLTAKELHDTLSTGLTSWTPPLYAVMREFVRRAEGYALACGDRDSARDELAEMKALRDAAKSDHKEACRILRNYQTLAEERGREINALIRERDELHRRAQANDALRSNVLREAVAYCRSQVESCSRPDPKSGVACGMFDCLAAAVTTDMERHFGVSEATAAQPTPAAPVTDAVPPDLAAALAWWGDGTEPKTMAEAVEKARSYRNDAHELADVAFELRNQPEGNPAEQVRRLLAPVTDAEIEAAITALTVDARREADALRVNPEASGAASEKRANRQVQLRALIARRVASAGAAPVDIEREAAIEFNTNEHVWVRLTDLGRRALLEQHDQFWTSMGRPVPTYTPPKEVDGWSRWQLWHLMSELGHLHGLGKPAPFETVMRFSFPPAPAGDQDAKLRELRARLLSTAASLPNRQMGHSDEDFDRGYVEACENWAQEIDRLLAAPAASAIAAAPEAPAWREKLDAAAAEIGDEHSYALSIALSDVDYDLRTVRSFVTALREQVESHARRIEALERANNKEAGK